MIAMSLFILDLLLLNIMQEGVTISQQEIPWSVITGSEDTKDKVPRRLGWL